MSTIAFSRPHNWCDSRCSYCVLAAECPLARLLDRTRRAHRAQGEDPDDPDVVVRDMVEELGRAVALLRTAAAEEGIDLEGPAPPGPPESLEARRFGRDGMELATAVFEALDEGAADAPGLDREEAGSAAVLVAAKLGRVASYLDLGAVDDELWGADAVPNLLLVEHALEVLDAALARLGDGPAAVRALRARATVERTVGPCMAAIPRSARIALARLVAARRAPSPFCRVADE